MSSTNSIPTGHRAKAFTTHGIAYDHQISHDVRKHKVLKIHPFRSRPFQDGVISAQDVAPSVNPTEEELSGLGFNKDPNSVLWVGMWVPGVEDALRAKINQTFSSYSGTRLPVPIADNANPLTVSYITNACRVGVSKKRRTRRLLCTCQPSGKFVRETFGQKG